eukprot:7944944-Ditylum_brightwellii.AAC.1
MGTATGTANCGMEVDGALFASQLDGLADGCERFRDRWNFDLISSAVEAHPDPCSKGRQDDATL